eukprot:Hpha_TRINITY_DN8751_c0_g1::TRINITY_DN8751_c0_g1_i1::g.45418::m.45418
MKDDDRSEGGSSWRQKSGASISIPVTTLLGLSTAVSTCVSIVGGLLMYFEGLKAIDETTANVARSESLVASKTLIRYFEEAEGTMRHLTKFYDSFTEPDSLEDVRRQLKRHFFSVASETRRLNGMGMDIIPSYDNPEYGMRQDVFWDPLTRTQDLFLNNGSDQQFVSTTYTQGRGVCEGGPVEGKRCMVGMVMNHKGDELYNVYNYTKPYIQNDTLDFWRTHHDQWQGVWSWKSGDGTQYYYGELLSVRPVAIPGHPVFGGMREIVVWVMLYDWVEELRGVDGAGGMMALEMKLGLDGPVYATTVETLVDICEGRKLELNDAECTATIRDLNKKSQEAALKVNGTYEGELIKTGLDGSVHWLMRRKIYTARAHDKMGEISLVWLLDTASTEGRVLRSLIYFVSFIAAVAVFDALILLLEVNKIAIPLRVLCKAMACIDDMDVDEIDARLSQVGTGLWAVRDILNLTLAFRKAAHSLRNYRDFLPQYCLPELATSGNDLAMSTSHSFAQSIRGRVSIPGRSHRSGGQTPGTGPGESPANLSLEPQLLAGSMSSANSSLAVSVHRGHQAPREKKIVANVVVNIVGCLRFTTIQRDEHMRCLVLQLQVACSSKGLIDGASGDRFWLSWNAGRSTQRCAFHAGEFAVRVGTSGDTKIKLSIGAASGEATCGVAGSTGFRYMALMGPVVSQAFQLERMSAGADRQGTRTSVIVNNKVRADGTAHFFSRWFATVVFPKEHAQPSRLWELLAAKEHASDGGEWMYQLQNDESNDPWEKFNQCVGLCEKGNYERALYVLKQADLLARIAANPIWGRIAAGFRTNIERAKAGLAESPTSPMLVLDSYMIPVPHSDTENQPSSGERGRSDERASEGERTERTTVSIFDLDRIPAVESQILAESRRSFVHMRQSTEGSDDQIGSPDGGMAFFFSAQHINTSLSSPKGKTPKANAVVRSASISPRLSGLKFDVHDEIIGDAESAGTE